MIEQVANNKYNTEKLNLNPPDKIKEKLDYYRTLFNKTHDLSTDEFEELKNNIKVFFNLKSVGFTDTPPSRLVRISNNNQILKAQGKELSYLTEISQILAPPIEYCNFGRCNIPNQQVLYCAVNEACAYWETKPKKGDIITLSHFELKPNTKVNCNIISKEIIKGRIATNSGEAISHMLEEFFVDIFSIEVSKERPKDYLFSSLLSSELLFYPIVSDDNIEAYIYPSVQKKKYGQNFAIRNDLIFEKYNLIGVETRFILNEYENIAPHTDELLTDNLIGSMGTETFNFNTGKILYNDDAPRMFKLFKEMQDSGGNQTRIANTHNIKNIIYNFSATSGSDKFNNVSKSIGRNDRVIVVYQNGTKKENIKFKFVEQDIRKKLCRMTKY